MYAQKAASIAQKVQFDLVHAHDWLTFPAGIIASSLSHRPLVSQVHATEFDRSGGTGANPTVYSIEKRGLDQAAKVIAVSNYVKNLLSRYYYTDTTKVAVVHNGIDAQDFAHTPPGDPLAPLKQAGFKVVTFIGRLTLQKGVDYFLRAAQLVIHHHPKVAFLIVGSGDMEHQLIEQVASAGISDHVLFAGFLRGSLLKSVYQHSDLFVMPSVSEPFGLTALESIAAGTPTIISHQSGVSEVINHALKVNFWDVEEMANQILAVITHSSLHRTLKTEGLVEVQKSTWAAAAAKTIAIYREILGK
jgi:glycosyltransferase involved in cell wall biosynthesis